MTEFTSRLNNNVQKIAFRDSEDVALLNAPVGAQGRENYYTTTQTVKVKTDGPSEIVPVLIAEYENANSCEVTVVNGLK